MTVGSLRFLPVLLSSPRPCRALAMGSESHSTPVAHLPISFAAVVASTVKFPVPNGFGASPAEI